MPALANSILKLSVGSEVAFTLRADLQGLATIAGAYHDLASLYVKIASIDLDASLNLIMATCTDPDGFREFYDSIFTDRGLEEFQTLITPQLLTFIERIAGVDDSTDSTEPSEPITLTELVERLFKIGAGWLEWAPDDVWDATPAEILLAREGLIEKLKAIHGSKDEETKTSIDLTKRRLSVDDKARLNKMGGLG